MKCYCRSSVITTLIGIKMQIKEVQIYTYVGSKLCLHACMHT